MRSFQVSLSQWLCHFTYRHLTLKVGQITTQAIANTSQGRQMCSHTRGAFRSTNSPSSGKSVNATSTLSLGYKVPLFSSVRKIGKAHAHASPHSEVNLPYDSRALTK